MLGECCLAPYAYGDALDVLCVRHEDASCRSTDWHVVFERLPRSGNNVVTVRILRIRHGHHHALHLNCRGSFQIDCGDMVVAAQPFNLIGDESTERR